MLLRTLLKCISPICFISILMIQIAVTYFRPIQLKNSISTSQDLCTWFQLCCGWIAIDFTHIFQGLSTETGVYMRTPVPVQQP